MRKVKVPATIPIKITDALDYFMIEVGPDSEVYKYYFNNDDHKRKLVQLFHHLGFKRVTYKEAYDNDDDSQQ